MHSAANSENAYRHASIIHTPSHQLFLLRVPLFGTVVRVPPLHADVSHVAPRSQRTQWRLGQAPSVSGPEAAECSTRASELQASRLARVPACAAHASRSRPSPVRHTVCRKGNHLRFGDKQTKNRTWCVCGLMFGHNRPNHCRRSSS